MRYKFTLVPQGSFPIQAEGELPNSEFFHLKQRGYRATLTVLDRPISSLDLGQMPVVIGVYTKTVAPIDWNETGVAEKVMPAFLALLEVHEQRVC